MEAPENEIQGNAAPAITVDENDELIGIEEPATEESKEEA